MKSDDAALTLETRDGLPEALRVLLEAYPREAWEADPNFSGLIRFWLDRHMMFRRLLATLDTDVERALDGATEARSYATRLSRFGGAFVNELHGHHMIEDHHYFPELRRLEPRIERGFDILDRDHHALDGHIGSFADRANAVLRGIGEGGDWRSKGEAFRKGTVEMSRFLERHLTDEEDLVVPVLLRYAPPGLT